MELFDEAARWLAGKGLGGQWGTQPWSERPNRRERISRSRLNRSSELTIAEVGDQVVGALEVSESSPSYAPKVHGNNLYIYMLLTSRQLIGHGIGRALVNHARADCRTEGWNFCVWIAGLGASRDSSGTTNRKGLLLPNGSTETAGFDSF